VAGFGENTARKGNRMTNENTLIKFTSSRFGELEILEEKIIQVPGGIIGFPDFQRFVLLDPSKGSSNFLWLQAIDSPHLAFIITDPMQFLPDYNIHGSEPALQRLEVEKKSPPALFVIASIPASDPSQINVNLLAPLLYFADENTMHQVVLEQDAWPLRYYLLEQDSGDPAVATDEEVR
jgi:flagellar assembly factor FliW